MKSIVVALLAAGLGACTTLTAEQCRSASWYDIGYRDGLFGMQAQTETYDSQCKARNAPFDQPRYSEGWRHGYWELEARRAHSGAD